MVQAGYQAEATGGRIVIENANRQPVRILVLPVHGVQQVPLETAIPLAPSTQKETTGKTTKR